MIRRSLLAVLLPTALLVPATALAATSVSGSKSDPKGETASHGDLVRASATYKSGGSLKAKISLASYADAAEQRTVVGAFFARQGRGGCNTKHGAAISFETDTKVAEGGLLPGSGKPGPAKGKVKGNVVTLSISGSRFARKRYDCVIVASLVATGPTTSKSLDRIDFRLKR